MAGKLTMGAAAEGPWERSGPAGRRGSSRLMAMEGRREEVGRREEEEGGLTFPEREKSRCANPAKKSRGSSEPAVPRPGLGKAG